MTLWNLFRAIYQPACFSSTLLSRSFHTLDAFDHLATADSFAQLTLPLNIFWKPSEHWLTLIVGFYEFIIPCKTQKNWPKQQPTLKNNKCPIKIKNSPGQNFQLQPITDSISSRGERSSFDDKNTFATKTPKSWNLKISAPLRGVAHWQLEQLSLWASGHVGASLSTLCAAVLICSHILNA